MTKKQRAQVVELLRCAVYEGTIYGAAAEFGLGPARKTVHLATAARQRVPYAECPVDGDLNLYQWMCLEAAARVEEGSWP